MLLELTAPVTHPAAFLSDYSGQPFVEYHLPINWELCEGKDLAYVYTALSFPL